MNALPLDPAILGRILLLQSGLQAAPDERRLAEMVARGLGSLPGIAECFVCLDGGVFRSGAAANGGLPDACRQALAASQTPDGCPRDCPLCSASDRWCHVLQAGLQTFGVISVRSGDSAWLQAYVPFLANTANLVALQLLNRRQAEQSLQMVCFSLDRIADAIFWADEQGRVIRINQAACRSLGYSEKELLSFSVWDVDSEFTAQRWEAH